MSAQAGVPRSAMVLAAGLGTRLRPITESTPKPLVPVAGRCALDRALDHLAAARVETVVVNCHHLAEQVERHVDARRSTPGAPRLVTLREESLLDSGGGVANALPHLGDRPFIVVNGDSVWVDGPRPALRRLAAAWDAERMDALLLVMPSPRAVGYEGLGDFTMDPHGALGFRTDRMVAPLVYIGVHIMHPRLLAGCPAGPFSLLGPWRHAAESGRLYGLVHDGLWYHVSTPADLAVADRLLRGRGVRWMTP